MFKSGLFTLLDTDLDTISIPKMGAVMIKDPGPDLNPSPCNGNSFCIVQCSIRLGV